MYFHVHVHCIFWCRVSVQHISIDRHVTSANNDVRKDISVIRSSGGSAIFHSNSDAPASTGVSGFDLSSAAAELEASGSFTTNTKKSMREHSAKTKSKKLATVGRPEMGLKISPSQEATTLLDDVSEDDDASQSSPEREDANGFDVDVDDDVTDDEEEAPLLLAEEVVTQILDDVITRAIELKRRKDARAQPSDVMGRLASLQSRDNLHTCASDVLLNVTNSARGDNDKNG